MLLYALFFIFIALLGVKGLNRKPSGHPYSTDTNITLAFEQPTHPPTLKVKAMTNIFVFFILVYR